MKIINRIIIGSFFLCLLLPAAHDAMAQEVTVKYSNDKNTEITIINNTGKVIYIFKKNEKGIKIDQSGITYNGIRVNAENYLWLDINKTIEARTGESTWNIGRNGKIINIFYYVREGNRIEKGKLIEVRPFNETIKRPVASVEQEAKETVSNNGPQESPDNLVNQNQNTRQETTPARQPIRQTTPRQIQPTRQVVPTPIVPREDPRLEVYRTEFRVLHDYYDNIFKDINTEVIEKDTLERHKIILDSLEYRLIQLTPTDEVKALHTEITTLVAKISQLIVEEKDVAKEPETVSPGKFKLWDDLIRGIRKRTGIPQELIIIILIASLILIVTMVLIIRSLIRKRKVKKLRQKEMEYYIRPVDEVTENITVYTSGLDDVRKSRPDEYYVVDMLSFFADTAIQTVYISRKCIMDIYKFFSEFLKYSQKTNETGCFVVGRWEYVSESEQSAYNITLEEIIKPGHDAIYGEYALDFGAEIGVGLESRILTLREKTGKDYLQMCWIHTHPGLGLFLSNHDLIVQSQLVYPDHPKRMLAIVIDSNTENLDMAFFAPKKDGAMNNKDELLKEMSLEDIYQWAKKSTKEMIENLNPDYYPHITNYSNTFIEIFLVSGAAIIDMDTNLALDSQGVAGYLYGNTQPAQKQVFIEEFNNSENDANSKYQKVGCLLVIPEFSLELIVKKYDAVINRFDFFTVYLTNDDSIRFVVKNIEGKFLTDDSHSVRLLDMKKWTRRRRV